MGLFFNSKPSKVPEDKIINKKTPVGKALASVGYKLDVRRIKELPDNVKNRIKKHECGFCGTPLLRARKDSVACKSKECVNAIKDMVREYESIEKIKKQRERARYTHDGQNKNGITYYSCGCNTNNLLHGSSCKAAGYKINK